MFNRKWYVQRNPFKFNVKPVLKLLEGFRKSYKRCNAFILMTDEWRNSFVRFTTFFDSGISRIFIPILFRNCYHSSNEFVWSLKNSCFGRIWGRSLQTSFNENSHCDARTPNYKYILFRIKNINEWNVKYLYSAPFNEFFFQELLNISKIFK